MADTPRTIGSGRNAWRATPAKLDARPLGLGLDLSRTAMVVADMQNAVLF